MSKKSKSYVNSESLVGSYFYDPVYQEFCPVFKTNLSLIKVGSKNKNLLFLSWKDYSITMLTKDTVIEDDTVTTYFSFEEKQYALKYPAVSGKLGTAQCLLL